MSYLKQKAHPWVSLAVLAGGMVSAIILFMLARIEASLEITITNI